MLTRWLASFAVVVAAVSLPAVASAKDHTAVDLVVDGDLPGARAAVVATLGGDLPADARAANMELLVVIERWSTSGGRPKARMDDTAVADGADWNASFVAAREALAEGRMSAAEIRLEALERTAPDAVSRARAHQLMTLAHDLGIHDAAVRSAAPSPAAPPPVGAHFAPEREPEEGRQWYGWETLICDGTAVVTAPFLIGIAGYVLCAPIVHLANGQPVKAAASIGVRLGAPLGLALAGGLIDAGANNGRCEFGCGMGGAIIGGGIGIVSAVVLDAAVLARKDVKRTEKSASLVPMGSARGDRVEVGLAGTF